MMLHHNLALVLLTFSYYIGAQTIHITLTTTSTQRATTLTSTLTTSSSTTVVPSAPSDPSWTSDSHFQSSCLNSTNTYRAQHDAGTVGWNDSLATWATRWTSKCLWAHSGLGFGENLAEGFASVADAIEGWGDERSMFDFARPHFTEETGHFSQLVWKGSTSMGCGRTYCGLDGHQSLKKVVARSNDKQAFGWMLACEYWPPGNVEGRFDENVHTQISNGETTHGLIAGGGTSEQGVIGDVHNGAMQLSAAVALTIAAMTGPLIVAVL